MSKPTSNTNPDPTSTIASPKPEQPLHPSIIPRLDPEYAAFYNKYLQYIPPSHTSPWDPASRIPTPPGTEPRTETEPLEVGGTRDWEVRTRGGTVWVRVYTPAGKAPWGRWPVVLFIPGGGWVYGGLDSQASFSTNMCVRAKCVVVSLDHRLAPEDPYPAALEDAIDTLKWLVQDGPTLLNVNTDRIAVGGCSSGGNLAAALVLTAPQLTPPIPLVFQLLIVPALDNTASTATSWHVNRHAPWLTPARMLWYRRMYLPDESDWATWRASPALATAELLKGVPETWIAVGGVDILREEGENYVRSLRAEGVRAEVKVYEGAPHAFSVMDGACFFSPRLDGAHCIGFSSFVPLCFSAVMQLGRTFVTDAVDALAQAFGTMEST